MPFIRTTQVLSTRTNSAALLLLLALAAPQLTQAQNLDLSNPGAIVVPIISGYEPGSNPNRAAFWPAGDINNDSIPDILVGSPNHKVGQQPDDRGNIVFGSQIFPDLDLNEFETTHTRGYYANDTAAQLLATSMAAAGDFNNDEIDDYIIGSAYGGTFLVYGGSLTSNLNLDTFTSSNARGIKISGQATNVAGIGDINNDGYDDIALANSFYNPTYPQGNDVGRIYVIYGRANATNITLSSFASSPQNGFTITGIRDIAGSAGDFDNDGLDDMVIALTRNIPVQQGGPFLRGLYIVIKGKSGGYTDIDYTASPAMLKPENAFAILGTLPNYYPEYQVGAPTTPRDFNGDGYSDLVLGSRNSSPDGATDAGAAYVIFGRDDSTTHALISSLDTPTTSGFRIDGITGEHFGNNWTWAGDLNNDNLADLAINAPDTNYNGLIKSGSTYVIYGKTSVAQTIDLVSNFVYGQDGYRIDGPRASAVLYPVVSAVGDMNNDEYDDFLIGTVYHNPFPQNPGGEAYLIYGKPIPAAGIQNWMNW